MASKCADARFICIGDEPTPGLARDLGDRLESRNVPFGTSGDLRIETLCLVEKRKFMIKKIAVVNDLSGFGKCSLTAAIPVIAAMGVQPCPLPTAVLSAQTGFPSYFYDDYTEKMEKIRAEWEKMDVHFDGIYTGFAGNEAQIRQMLRFLDTFYKKGAFLLVDPIMGDEGKIFSIFTPELLAGMKELAGEADLITPNLTELCLLTGTDYRMLEQMTDEKHLVTIAEQMGQNFLRKGSNSHVKKAVVVTGIRFKDEKTGAMKIGNLVVTKRQTKLLAFPYIGGSFSGTGDLFASILAGGMARGEDLFETVELAGTLIGAAMADAAEEKVPRNEGANYEKYLGMLIPGADWKNFGKRGA